MHVTYECFEKHKDIQCAKLKICRRCTKVVVGNFNKHDCLLHVCNVCGKVYTLNYICFVSPLDGEKLKKEDAETNTIFIFYDFETV